MIVTQISDTHICLPEPEASHRLRDLEMAVDEINAFETPPDVVIHSGDIAHNGTNEEYQTALDLLGRLNSPYYVIPGNRDRRKAMRNIFSQQISTDDGAPFIQYALDQWDTRLIMLDTLNEGDRLGTLCDQRLGHLGEMLAADKHKQTVIFMHHPPYDVMEAPHPFQFDSRRTIQKLQGVLSGDPQIRGIYCGHSHRNTSGMLGEIPATTLTALSIDLRFGEYPLSHINRPVFTTYKF